MESTALSVDEVDKVSSPLFMARDSLFLRSMSWYDVGFVFFSPGGRDGVCALVSWEELGLRSFCLSGSWYLSKGKQ